MQREVGAEKTVSDQHTSTLTYSDCIGVWSISTAAMSGVPVIIV